MEPNLSVFTILQRQTKTNVECSEIARTITPVTSSLEDILKDNINALLTKTGTWLTPHIFKEFEILDLSVTSAIGSDCDLESVHLCNADLIDVIEGNNEILKACSLEIPVFGRLFATEACPMQTGQRFKLAKLMDSVACSQCRGLYSRSGISSHAGSLRCMRDAQCLELVAAGYQIMSDSTAVTAIRKAGIEFKVRPSELDMWVPSWVAAAVNDYRKKNVFAGLKLHEFLKAVGGNI